MTQDCVTALVEQEMKKDWLFAPHYRYYVREMRIQAYSQLLESYRSLTLGYMAEAFGVSTEFIDQWVSAHLNIQSFISVTTHPQYSIYLGFIEAYCQFKFPPSIGNCLDSSLLAVSTVKLTKWTK